MNVSLESINRDLTTYKVCSQPWGQLQAGAQACTAPP